MVGPTRQGMDDLIARDPSAYWDTYNNKVVSSMHPSPRVVAIPLFDPVYYDTGKQNGRNADLKVGQLHGVLHRRDAGQQRRRTNHAYRRNSDRQRRPGADRCVSHSNRSRQVTAEPMAQLTVLISSTDTDFRAHVTKCLRASGTSVAVVDERHATANPPSLAIVDIRQGARTDAIERLRGSWPSATIFAIASSAQPEQILQAMRAGANEYLAWPHRRIIHGGHPPGGRTSRSRKTARARAACCRSSASKGAPARRPSR